MLCSLNPYYLHCIQSTLSSLYSVHTGIKWFQRMQTLLAVLTESILSSLYSIHTIFTVFSPHYRKSTLSRLYSIHTNIGSQFYISFFFFSQRYLHLDADTQLAVVLQSTPNKNQIPQLSSLLQRSIVMNRHMKQTFLHLY